MSPTSDASVRRSHLTAAFPVLVSNSQIQAPPQRVWTPESIEAWRNERNERRKKQGLKPMHELSPKDKLDTLEGEKRELIDKEFSILSTQAWEVGKHPLTSFAAPFNGYLLLPKSYHARNGTHRIRVRKGDDLNRILYQYYDEFVDPKIYPGDNYVSNDGILTRRHEYLGPSPRIASYRLTSDEIEVEWWEAYIKDAWIGSKKWKVEAEFDEAVEAWFLVDRNNY